MNAFDRININIRNFIIYLMILIASVVFASFCGGLLPYVLLYGMFLLLPVSTLYIILSFAFISVYQELDVHRLVKSERHRLSVSLENTGLLPVHDVELILFIDRCDFDGIHDGETISLDPKEKKLLEAKTSCLFAGSYDVGLKGLRFNDAFRIFSISFNIPYSFKAIVSPKITDIADRYLDIENILNSTGHKSRMRYEEIPGNDLRSYYPGDAISKINWKVSARLGDLYVRVPDKLDTRIISLYLEPVNTQEKLKDTDFLKRRDFFLEFAVSAAYYFAGRGIPVHLIYPAGKITEKTIDSYEGFHEFYNDASAGISYRSDDEHDRMHKLIQERRYAGDGSETRVFILEEAWGSGDFCVIAG